MPLPWFTDTGHTITHSKQVEPSVEERSHRGLTLHGYKNIAIGEFRAIRAL